jgi:hypothetical protein
MPIPRLYAALLALAVALPALAAERWRLAYAYDGAEDDFRISAFAFPSAQRGMAVGSRFSLDRQSSKPAGFATTDGGRTWVPMPVPETPLSLFFLNDRVGWLVGSGHIFKTVDFGVGWKRVGSSKRARKVYFLDENHGWACGPRKTLLETTDGGAKWTAVPAAAEPKTTVERTVYTAIAFANERRGIVAGWSGRPAMLQGPLESEFDLPREVPAVTILLQTNDAGARWNPFSASTFGRITEIRLTPDGRGLALIQFYGRFDWPSEVHRIEWRTGKSTGAFREKNRQVSDAALAPGGPAYLAAIEPPGELPHGPLPGKVKLLRSDNLTDWTEMAVDYRAVARHVFLAAPDAGNAWAATDTGMIFRLVRE